jgi:formate-nitrite transporter family protein
MSQNLTLSVPINEGDHVIGPAEPSVVVVTYGDYESSDCQRREREVVRVFDELLKSVRYVYRHFPLITVHPRALRAAEAAEAAAAQEKFWEMHRLLYFHSSTLSDHDLRKNARKIGLDLKQFDQDMESSTYATQILKDYSNSLVHGITGAPTTFVNGVLYAMSGIDLIDHIKALLKQQTNSQDVLRS